MKNKKSEYARQQIAALEKGQRDLVYTVSKNLERIDRLERILLPQSKQVTMYKEKPQKKIKPKPTLEIGKDTWIPENRGKCKNVLRYKIMAVEDGYVTGWHFLRNGGKRMASMRVKSLRSNYRPGWWD